MRALVLALALCLSCSGARAVPDCQPDPDFTGDEMDALARAASQWSGITHEPVRLTSAGPWRLIKASPPDFRFVGQTLSAQHVVYIAPGLHADTFYGVAIHELGHVVGLQHISERGVMNPSVGETTFSAADIAECRRVRACE